VLPKIFVTQIVIRPEIDVSLQLPLTEVIRKPEDPLRNEVRLASGEVDDWRPGRLRQIQIE